MEEKSTELKEIQTRHDQHWKNFQIATYKRSLQKNTYPWQIQWKAARILKTKIELRRLECLSEETRQDMTS